MISSDYVLRFWGFACEMIKVTQFLAILASGVLSTTFGKFMMEFRAIYFMLEFRNKV